MKDCSTHYEYICVYVDDLAIAMKNPKEFTDLLVSKYGYKLMGVGPVQYQYHLGGDVFRDPDGTLCFGAKTYITRLLENCEKLFGEKPKEQSCPMERGDHPELDESPELDSDGIRK
jgi:hypothetical protein